ncbi:MAG: 4-hydroxy-tetrahydrodipicolinate reductase [Lentisphaerae bacterium RIFOXYA12_FULL_48_11]|nr:MAG: 4-hydroxy-tetrahydrodipicolinate reductase [Lentisphaerae bacterium RIFOXYA12_FULL_48_11]
MTRIAVAGAAGRMGQAIIRSFRSVPGVELVAATEMSVHKGLGKDVGVLAGTEKTGILLSDDLQAAITAADVLIDFTFHTAVPLNTKMALQCGRAMVIGTTGLDAVETDIVKKATEKLPIVWAPNMSIGVNLLFAIVKQAATALATGYKVEIDETHHIHKKDSPSGTALKLGEKVAEGLGLDFKSAMVHDADGALRKHPEGKIVIRSHREGEVVGDHTVSFGNDAERIEFTHRAWSRESLALGAIRAAQWVVSRKPGLYDMQDVLGL